jgi:hypothetical protein
MEENDSSLSEHQLKMIQRKMRRKGSDVSVIQEIVKKK